MARKLRVESPGAIYHVMNPKTGSSLNIQQFGTGPGIVFGDTNLADLRVGLPSCSDGVQSWTRISEIQVEVPTIRSLSCGRV